ncbi:ATP synthase subunit I [Hathewaya massiliensis]|uniref:ATP synthase subunit I n=1 Tax=Hathewaya massiliensis TaxID=1964382 RepID=UPI0011574B3A|nr:ATP synthase subunit I [Hathewaya massiliensis]
MIKDITDMLKKVVFNTFAISLMGSIILYFINKKYMVPFFIGSFMGIFSLIINSFTTTNILKNNKNKGILLLSSMLRVILVCMVGAIIAKNNMEKIIPYILGYSVEFLGMILYGVSLNKEV